MLSPPGFMMKHVGKDLWNLHVAVMSESNNVGRLPFFLIWEVLRELCDFITQLSCTSYSHCILCTERLGGGAKHTMPPPLSKVGGHGTLFPPVPTYHSFVHCIHLHKNNYAGIVFWSNIYITSKTIAPRLGHQRPCLGMPSRVCVTGQSKVLVCPAVSV